MGEFYTYQKKRREYGKFCNFADTEIKHWFIIGPPTVAQYIQRDPNFIDLDNIPELTEHVVNTERVSTKEQGMAHKEGGKNILFLIQKIIFNKKAGPQLLQILQSRRKPTNSEKE